MPPYPDPQRAHSVPAPDASINAVDAQPAPADAVELPRLARSVSIEQAARLLNVSRRTIYNRIRDGRLRTTRTIGGSNRILVTSLYEMGFRPQALSASASATTFNARPTRR